MLKSKTKKSLGFTLIEILVVIAVVGILSAVVLTFLNAGRYKARNAKRNSDIKQIIHAFNLGLTASNSLPSTSGVWKCVSTSCTTYSADTLIVDPFLAPYISKTTDPTDSTRTANGYIYNSYVAPGGAFSPGAYLYWYVEPPSDSTSCGVGFVRSVGATDINCVYKLD